MNIRLRKNLSKEIKAGVKYLHIALVAIIVLSGFVFLYNLSQSAYKGYQFHQYEIDYVQKENENDRLKVKSLEAQSYESLEEQIETKGMTSPKRTQFYDTRQKRLSLSDDDSV